MEIKTIGLAPLRLETLSDLQLEVGRARKKFPTNEDRLAALIEKVGELAKALLEQKYGNGSSEEVREEALQTMAMAARILEEGDAGFPFDPNAYLYD